MPLKNSAMSRQKPPSKLLPVSALQFLTGEFITNKRLLNLFNVNSQAQFGEWLPPACKPAFSTNTLGHRVVG